MSSVPTEPIETVAPFQEAAVQRGSLNQIARFGYCYAPFLTVPIVLALFATSLFQVLGLIGVLLLLGLRWGAYGAPIARTRINLPLFVVLIMVAFSLSMSPVPTLAVSAACKIVAGVLVFYVVFDNINSVSDMWRITALLVMGGLGLAYVATGTAQWMNNKIFSWDEFYNQEWFRFGPELNPNRIAGMIVPMVPVALCLMFSRVRRYQILGAIGVGPMLLVLVLLQARGALIALAIGLVLFLCLAQPRLTPVLVIVISAGAILFTLIPSLIPRSLLALDSAASLPLSLAYRADLWKRSLLFLVESPFIGTGLAAFPTLAEQHPIFQGIYTYSTPHNTYLQVGLDIGILGALAFMLIVGIALYTLWQAYRNQLAPPLAIGLLTALTVLALDGIVGVVFWASKNGVILWVLLSLAVAFFKLAKGQTDVPVKSNPMEPRS